ASSTETLYWRLSALRDGAAALGTYGAGQDLTTHHDPRHAIRAWNLPDQSAAGRHADEGCQLRWQGDCTGAVPLGEFAAESRQHGSRVPEEQNHGSRVRRKDPGRENRVIRARVRWGRLSSRPRADF